MSEPVRTLVLWLPDWPVTAFLRENDDEDHGAPIGIVRAGVIVACSASARAEGVRRGLRLRDAQARCPSLLLVDDDPPRDDRAFAPVLDRIEDLAPGVHVVRGGLCALRVRGPARYYGGEEAAAQVLSAAVAKLGLPDVRAGIGDGLFTAEHAARRASAPGSVVIVNAGSSREFLAPLPISALRDDALIDLLSRLGVRTLGDFAALDAERVRERVGSHGLRLHELAGGRDSDPITPRVPPPDLSRTIDFEPPLEVAEQVAFGVRQAADEVIAGLGARDLVCTGLRIELFDERGHCSERVWLHPTFFGASEIVDRVRWQLEAALAPSAKGTTPGDTASNPAVAPAVTRVATPAISVAPAAASVAPAATPSPARPATPAAKSAGSGLLEAAVARVHIVPDSVDAASHHDPGLFGQGPGERVHHALSRVQAMLGHRGVLVPLARGGRWLSERQSFTPWGDRPARDGSAERPWPGSLPAPLPDTVYAHPLPADLTGKDGSRVEIDERGNLTREPALLMVGGTQEGSRIDSSGETAVVSWAGPWPVREREWDRARRREAHRLQLVDAMDRAWIVVLEEDRWWIEGRYE